MSKPRGDKSVEPGNWFLTLQNDNINTIPDVVQGLADSTSLDYSSCYRITLMAHKHSNAIILTGTLRKLSKIHAQLKAKNLTSKLVLIKGGFELN